MTDPWKYGQHYRALEDMYEPYYHSRPEHEPELLPAWLDGLLLVLIVVIVLGLVVFGWTHPTGVHS